MRHMSQATLRAGVVRQPAMATALKLQTHQPMWRSYAAEAGFLDKEDVTSRVLEVVRKFEKVRTRLPV